MEQTILIVSDLHLGAGETIGEQENPLEDFHFDERFAEFLSWKVNQYSHPLELLILGDAFDFPQVLPEIGLKCTDSRLGTTQEESVSRLEIIIKGHRVFFHALRDFLSTGNSIRILRGNHDIDLIWPDIQARIRYEIGGGSKLIFEDSYIHKIRGLYCEHGNQYSAENSFTNPARPILTDSHGKARLERCWGTYFMDVVYNDIERRFPAIDNIEDGQVIQGALKAIKSEKVRFTGKVVGKMLKIAYRAGLPVWGWLGSWTLGDETTDIPHKDEPSMVRITNADDFIKYLNEPEISDNLLGRFKDEPGFRDQFEAEMEEVVRENIGKEMLFTPEEDINKTLGVYTGKSDYERAAEKILQKNPGLDVVVFGHTHTPIDGNFVKLSNNSTGRYFNSGSWTSHIDLHNPDNLGKNFDELCDSGIRKDTLDFVEIAVASDGKTKAVLGSG
jgi:UDP-2,3-diacylglucosamine pyrophosphatase LpxH